MSEARLPITVEVEANVNQTAFFTLLAIYVLPLAKRTAWLILILTLTAIWLVTLAVDEPLMRETDTTRLLLAGIGLPATWFLAQFLNYRHAYRSAGWDRWRYRLTIDETGVHRANDSDSISIPWSDVVECLRLFDWIFLRLREGGTLYIPGQAFGSRERLEVAYAVLRERSRPLNSAQRSSDP